MNVENWLPVVGYEGLYEVSDLGRVHSLARNTTRNMMLKPGVLRYGYHGYSLHKNGVRTSRSAHQLVLEAFVGPRPEGYEGAHINGHPPDNRLVNLKWKTRTANQADRVLHGTDIRGEKNVFAKLCEADFPRIRDLQASGVSQRKIAKWFGVCQTTLRNALTGVTWRVVRTR